MANVSKTEYRGLIIPDHRVKNANISSTSSDYTTGDKFTQAGPQPGIPVDTSSTLSDLVLKSSGTQGANGEIRIKANKGGFPDVGDNAGQFVWYDENAVAQLVIQDLRYDAVTAGEDGELVSIEYTTGATAGSEVVTVTGNAISIQIASGSSNATQIKNAFDAEPDATALATCVNLSLDPDIGTGGTSIVQTGPVSATNLAIKYMGHNKYGILSDFQYIKFDQDGTGGANDILYTNPRMVTLDDGSIVMCYQIVDNDGATTAYRIGIQTFDPDTMAWTERTDITPDSTTATSDSKPTIIKLPNGRLQIYFWNDNTTTSLANISMYFSDDNGVTWTIGSGGVLNNNINRSSVTGIGLIDAEYSAGQVLLVSEANDSDNGIFQWASLDLGQNFIDVTVTAGTALLGFDPNLTALSGGGFLLTYGKKTDLYFLSRSIGNAFEPLEDISAITINNAGTWQDTTSWKTSYNTHLAAGRDGGSNDIIIFESEDDGATWKKLCKQNVATPTDWDTSLQSFNDATSTGLINIAGAETRGFCIIGANFLNDSAISSNDTNSLICIQAGGYSTVTMPSLTPNKETDGQGTFAHSYIGITEPGVLATEWTATTSGTRTRTLESTGYKIINLTGSEYWTTTDSTVIGTTATDGLLVYADLIPGSGALLTQNDIVVQMVLGNNVQDWDVTFRFTDAAIAVFDNQSGNEIARVTTSLSSGVQLLAAMKPPNTSSNATLQWWYRTGGNTTTKEWKEGQNLTIVRNTVSPAAFNKIIFGTLIDNTATVTWRSLCYRKLDDSSQDIENGQSNPDDLFSRNFSSSPIDINGTKISAVDGPAVKGETWSIDTRYQFGIENIDPFIQPSRDIVWRSTDETAQEIIWNLNTSDEATRYGSKTLAIMLENINFRDFQLHGYNSSWTQLTNVATEQDWTGTSATRSGDVLISDGTGGPSDWFDEEELVGATVDLGSSKFRKILHNTSGKITSGNDKFMNIFMDGIDGTENVAPTFNIHPTRILVIIHGVTQYKKLRLTIPADVGKTVDGYFHIGSCIIGRVLPFPTQYSHGRSIETIANTELTERQDGSRFARKLGKTRRTVNFSWNEGVDTSTIYQSAEPDYIELDISNNADGVPGEMPNLVHGLMDRLDGSYTPVVYLPYIPVNTTPNDNVFNHKRDWVYGRIVSSANTEVIVGDEHDSSGGAEVMRISNITIEEEL